MIEPLNELADIIIRLLICIKKGFPLRLAICDLPFSTLPTSTNFSHPYGITIRGETRIGDDCIIRQNVTIGQRRDEPDYAVIGNNVSIGAGVIILGAVHIGDNVTIGAGSIVLEDIPSNSVYITKLQGICKPLTLLNNVQLQSDD